MPKTPVDAQRKPTGPKPGEPPDSSSDPIFYWDWTTRQRLAVVAAALASAAAISTLVWSGVGFVVPDWRFVLGGTAFFGIPVMVGFLLFVGLRTGLMPQRGRRVSRTENPIDFWFTGALYAFLLAMYLYFVLIVALDGWRSGWR